MYIINIIDYFHEFIIIKEYNRYIIINIIFDYIHEFTIIQEYNRCIINIFDHIFLNLS
jgi:hypothetical protein